MLLTINIKLTCSAIIWHDFMKRLIEFHKSKAGCIKVDIIEFGRLRTIPSESLQSLSSTEFLQKCPCSRISCLLTIIHHEKRRSLSSISWGLSRIQFITQTFHICSCPYPRTRALRNLTLDLLICLNILITHKTFNMKTHYISKCHSLFYINTVNGYNTISLSSFLFPMLFDWCPGLNGRDQVIAAT